LSECEDGSWGYAVFLFERSIVYMFVEADLESTGRFEPPETFRSVDVIRVLVDPVTGEGRSAVKRAALDGVDDAHR